MVDELVDSYRRQAEAALKSAKMHYDDWNYASCIHEAQLAVELMLKALLKKFTGDFPKKHDIGLELFEAREKLPEAIRRYLPRLWFVSKVLASWREPSIYGLEAEQTPPDKFFTKKEAEVALSYAEEVKSICLGHLY